MISQARRISAISCASLIIRQPAVTGVPFTSCIAGAALPISSANVNGIISSMPIFPVVTPRSFRIVATRAEGDSCSSQARTSLPIFTCSSARAFSNAGVTQAGSPSRVMTQPKKRSEIPQRAPVK